MKSPKIDSSTLTEQGKLGNFTQLIIEPCNLWLSWVVIYGFCQRPNRWDGIILISQVRVTAPSFKKMPYAKNPRSHRI